VSSFRVALSSDPIVCLLQDSVLDLSASSVHEASLALKELLCCAPRHFANDASILTLTGTFLSNRDSNSLLERF
jgi:hypothetical protein